MIQRFVMLEGFHVGISLCIFFNLTPFFGLKLNNDKKFQGASFPRKSHFKKLLIVPSQGKEKVNLVL